MTADEIIAGLKKEFPDKNIISNPEDHPTEILCEVKPSALHWEYSEAIAYIKCSMPHRHLKSTETYKVESGELILFLDGARRKLTEGKSTIIKPGVIHWAEGDWARVNVKSEPGWTLKDHILAERATSAGGVILQNDKILFVKFPDSEGITFPKGHIEEGESYEQAALREVSEETGFTDLQIVKKLGVVTRPAIERDDRRVIKDIHLFLIKVVGDSQREADEQTEWLSFEEALVRLLPQEVEFLKSTWPKLN